MAEYLIQSETLDDIADAINAKTGGSSAMTPAEMVTAIWNISGGANGLAMHTGEITVVGASETDVTINHGFDDYPVIVAVYPKSAVSIAENHIIGAIGIVNSGTLGDVIENLPPVVTTGGFHIKLGWYTAPNKPNGASETSSYSYVKSVSQSDFVFGGSASYPVLATTYIWKAYAFEGGGA